MEDNFHAIPLKGKNYCLIDILTYLVGFIHERVSYYFVKLHSSYIHVSDMCTCGVSDAYFSI